jgi:hypothetical protein
VPENGVEIDRIEKGGVYRRSSTISRSVPGKKTPNQRKIALVDGGREIVDMVAGN